MKRPRLPIDERLGEIRARLDVPGANLVVTAPPGAGKTTTVPVEAAPGKTWCAQPRRIAARAAAGIAARWAGEPVGATIGYRVRDDSKVSTQTRTCFVTDGVLVRRLRDDAALNGLDTIVLDEVHERSARSDLALALALWRQRTSRPDLRIVAMSATVDADAFAGLLDAPVIASEGRRFDVEVSHAAGARDRPLEARVLRALQTRIDAGGVGDVGHVLVFLPGAAEIRRCARALSGYASHHGFEVLPLHGGLTAREQDRAIAPSDHRRIVLATNVAETSVTIDGVRLVIDSGLARRAEVDERDQLSRLVLRPIARASAEQRAGRAGRTAAGHCVRLYARGDLERRPAHEEPEIRRADLAEIRLHLAAAGVRDVGELAWLDAPRPDAWEAAARLLLRLDAIDADGCITSRGTAMARLPLGPRLAHVCEGAARGGYAALAAAAAAVLSDRPLRRRLEPSQRKHDADVLVDVEDLERVGRARGNERRRAAQRLGLSPSAVESVSRVSDRLRERLRSRGSSDERDPERRERALRRALLVAFAERLCRVRVRDARRELIPIEGPAMELVPGSVVHDAEWVVALRVESRRDGARTRTRVESAVAVEVDWVIDELVDLIDEQRVVEFDDALERAVARSRLSLGNLVLEETTLDTRNPDASLQRRLGEVLLERARAEGVGAFCDLRGLESLRRRAALVAKHGVEVASVDDAALDAVLADVCAGASSFAELRGAKMHDLVRARLGASAAMLDRLAPKSVRLPGGRTLEVDYSGADPSVASYLQDFFGMLEGPRIVDGRVPLVLHLRAPNQRDVQVTRDLAGFWDRHYPELRRALSRRYPKHAWPEDPRAATPPKPRGRRRRR